MANKKQLKEALSRWKSHNEVFAKKSDEILYDLLEKVIESLGDDKEEELPVVEEAVNSFIPPAEVEEDDGSNPPSGPATPP